VIKFEAWVTRTFPSHRTCKTPNAAYCAAANDASCRDKGSTCKWPACEQRTIFPGSKYILVRCSSDCVSHVHPACYDAMMNESDETQVDAIYSAAAAAAAAAVVRSSDEITVKCVRAKTTLCKGLIVKAVMKQQHKVRKNIFCTLNFCGMRLYVSLFASSHLLCISFLNSVAFVAIMYAGRRANVSHVKSDIRK
jgi:hypothetical protein